MDTAIERKRLFKILAYLIFLLFLLNYVASKFYWYFSIWWIDMPIHFLGGLCAGFVVIWLLSFKKLSFDLFISTQTVWNFIFKIFLGVLSIGVLWELFEILFNNIIAQNSFNTLDTISDVFFDLVGGTFAILFFLKQSIPKKEITV
ncbi:MAG: hypothetical protein WCW93_02165 [Candidatus Paceibacterota bacterium]